MSKDTGGSNSPGGPAGIPAKTIEKLKKTGFSIQNKIGQGAFAVVYEAKYEKEPDMKLAAKVINTALASKEYRVKFLPRELDATVKLHHPNVIKTIRIFKEEPHRVFIFMALAKSDLFKEIKKSGKLTENQTKNWLFQMLSGLSYLHKNNFAHRDMKLENILIDFDNHAVLSDFGFVRRMEGPKGLSDTHCGSLEYAAPEILATSPYSPFPSDVWAVGVIFYSMLTGGSLFQETRVTEMRKVQRSVHSKINARKDIPSVPKDLLLKMLTLNPTTRIKVDDALKHPYFEGLKKPPELPPVPPSLSLTSKPSKDSPKTTSKPSTGATPSTSTSTSGSKSSKSPPKAASPKPNAKD